MINNLIIIAPIFVIMTAGFVMGRTNLFPEGSGAARTLTTFVWYIAIPALIIKLIAGSTLPSIIELKNVLGYYLVLYIFYFISAFLVAPKLNINPKGRGIFALTCCFGNLGFVGIPVIQSALGEEGLRVLMMIMSFHMLTLLPITNLITEYAKHNTGSALTIMQRAIWSSIKNPVVISLFIGLTWSALELGLSPIAIRILEFPAAAAAPVGLFAVGLSLCRVKLSGEFITALVPVTLKIILLPIGVYFMMSQLLEAPQIWVNTATLAACMPTGMAAYGYAEQYNTETVLVSSTILIGAVISAFTLVIAISLLI